MPILKILKTPVNLLCLSPIFSTFATEVNIPKKGIEKIAHLQSGEKKYSNSLQIMEKTLVLLKPSCVERCLVGEVIKRIEQRGIIICGLKMMQLDEKILREHYAHLVDKPFFPSLAASMMASPVIAMVLKGVDIVEVFRKMTGVTNGRKAEPGTLRGDFCMSGQANIIHASDSVENAQIEIARFFKPEEVFDYTPANITFYYGDGEN